MPGINPALLSTLIVAMWIVGIVHVLRRARALTSIASRSRSATVLPSGDVDDDVERLSHENPDDAARGMAHSLEVQLRGACRCRCGVMLPATALYTAAINAPAAGRRSRRSRLRSR